MNFHRARASVRSPTSPLSPFFRLGPARAHIQPHNCPALKMTEEEEEEEEKEKTIVERPISRAFVDCSSVKKRAARCGNVVIGGKRKADCIFFPRFDDASESFSLDVLLVAGKLDDDDDDSERGGRRKKNDENDSLARSFVHFRTDGFVSKPKGGVIYENWYQRAKEALSPRGEGCDDAYEISIEEKNKKRSERKKEVGGGDDDDQDDDDDDDGEEVDIKLLVWRFPGEEEERPYSGSCDIKRVAEAPETGTSVAGGDATANAATTKTKTKTTAATMVVLLELLRHSSAKYISEMEKNVDLKRANECLRRDQELAVKEESRKARDIEQFKRKCLEECLVLVNEKKKRIRELEEILETARKENDALTRKLEKKGGKERRKASSSASDEEDYSSNEDESDEDEGEEEEEEEANTDDEDKDMQVRKRMRQTAMADTIKTTASNGGRKKPKSTTTATTKATASQKQKSKPAARGANTFDALMQANLGRDSDDANSQSSSF